MSENTIDTVVFEIIWKLKEREGFFDWYYSLEDWTTESVDEDIKNILEKFVVMKENA